MSFIVIGLPQSPGGQGRIPDRTFPVQACRDFLVLAQTHSKKWQKSLQYERDQRIRLEETLEQLAKQHNHLERAFRGATVLPANTPGSAGSGKGETRSPVTSFHQSLQLPVCARSTLTFHAQAHVEWHWALQSSRCFSGFLPFVAECMLAEPGIGGNNWQEQAQLFSL